MIYKARTEANDILIATYETEEPRKFMTLANLSTTKEWDKWQSSKREYKVRSEDKEEIEGILFAKFVKENRKLNHYGYVFNEVLSRGIDCTFLKDRINLNEHECKGNNHSGACLNAMQPKWCKEHCGEKFEPFWTLLPLEDKKENEWPSENDIVKLLYQTAKKRELADGGYSIDRIFRDEAKAILELFKNPNKAI